MEVALREGVGQGSSRLFERPVTTRNVVVVAPFAPQGRSVHLGAEKKIQLVLGLLNRLGFDVHLVDSSHPTLAFAAPIVGEASIVGETTITLWRPGCLPNRKLGKLINVLTCHGFMRRLRVLRPAFVWVYNPYSFEARSALYLKWQVGAPIALELEDLPLSRPRSLNPKPWIDQFFFPRLLAATDLLTCVNAALRARFARPGLRSILFPSLLQQALVDARPTPRFVGAAWRLGYFGGLETEKGAELLLRSLPHLPESWTLCVTGAGSLAAAFDDAAKLWPGRLEFHGRVANDRMLALMQGCDAIVNPHSPISLMRDGVFPFKVCEALAIGALLISTALPPIDVDLASAVLSFDGSVDGLIRALTLAPKFHADHAAGIARARVEICEQFSEASIFRQLRAEIDVMVGA